MKKILFISMLSCIVITLHAQKIQMVKKPLPTSATTQTSTTAPQQQNRQVLPPTSVTTQTTNKVSQKTVNNNNLIHKVIPIPNKIKFIKLTRSLVLSSPMSGTQPMSGTKNNNVMVSNNRNFTNSNSVTKNMSSASKANLAIIYNTVTKNYGKDNNGKVEPKTYYRLTNNTGNWPSDPVLKSNTLNKKPGDSPDPTWGCNYVTETFTAQSTSFMNATKNQIGAYLVPGAIYTFEDYSGGIFNEYTDGRNPINIFTEANTQINNSIIQNPNRQTIRQGISNIVNQFSPTGDKAGSIQQIYFSENQADMNLMLSAGGSYAGFSGFGTIKQNESEHHIYMTIDAVKPLYSIDVIQPENGYFANGKIPSTSSPLIVIRNVTYGTRILANVDIRTTSKTNFDSLHLAYSGVADAKFDLSVLAKDQSYTFTGNFLIVGTNTNIPIMSLQNFQQQLSDLFVSSNYNTAAPIEYELGDLDGNKLGVESATDQFTYPDCRPVDETLTLQSVFASITTGDDGKDGSTDFWLEVYKGSQDPKPKIGTYHDRGTAFTKGSTSPVFPITFPPEKRENSYTMDDFKDGGEIMLRMYSNWALGIGDEWHVSILNMKFTFKSNKGDIISKYMTMNNFQFNDHQWIVFYFDKDFNLQTTSKADIHNQ